MKDRVKKDALAVKQQGALEDYVLEVRKKAQVKFVEDFPYRYENPVVARVNDAEIKLEDVSQVVFANPQVPQLIQQGLGELVVQFFYPTTLDQLVTNELLYQEAKKTGLPFIGPKARVASDVQLWKTKDLAVTEEEVRAYYEKNKAQFTEPATASLVLARFEDEAKAKEYREGVLKGEDPKALAEKLGGQVVEAEQVAADQLPPVLLPVVFGDAPKADAPAGKVSDVIKVGEKDYEVAIVRAVTPEVVRPFEEVRAEAEKLALAEKRAEAARAWIEELKKQAKIENRLQEVLDALAPKTEAPEGGEAAPEEEPKETTP